MKAPGKIVFCLLCLFTGSMCFSATLYVDDNAPSDPASGDTAASDPLEDGSQTHPFDAIQEAIDAADANDTVLVADGTYTGDGNRDMDFLGKAITVQSENGPEQCIIDCQGTETEPNRAFVFQSGETHDSILSGFSIINGYAGQVEFITETGEHISSCFGGGVFVDNASPTIRNCTFENCFGDGGAIFCFSGTPIVIDSLFRNNIGGAAAIRSDQCSMAITNCQFTENDSTSLASILWTRHLATFEGVGAVFLSNGTAAISNCIFSGNNGYFNGALTLVGLRSDIRQSIFVGNRGVEHASITGNFFGDYEEIENDKMFSLENTIFVNNFIEDAFESLDAVGLCLDDIGFPYFAQIYEINYSCVQPLDPNLPGMGNIEADPLFVQPGYWDTNGTPEDETDDVWVEGDYHLQDNSPCIDAGDPNYIPPPDETDLDGNPRLLYGAVDMGVYEAIDPYHTPWISVNADKFHFVAQEGQTDFIEQVLAIHTPNTHQLNWSIENSVPWLEVTPSSGSCFSDADEVALKVNVQGLTRGSYSGTFSIYGQDAPNSPLSLQVSLLVTGIIHVPADYTTIQVAINAANSGDIVLVSDGTYTGQDNRDIDFLGKAITVQSQSGPENCIIDIQATPEEPHTGFYFHSGENADSVLDGFTIQNGFGIQIQYNIWTFDPEIVNSGGGIAIQAASPTIKNSIIRKCRAPLGAGLAIFDSYPGHINSSPVILNCTFYGNSAIFDYPSGGGAVYINEYCSVIFKNCIFTGNMALAGPSLSGFLYDGSVIQNCTFHNNKALDLDGSIYGSISFLPVKGLTVTNTIFAENMFNPYCTDCDKETTITYNNFPGDWKGFGNIDVDPQFVNPGYWEENGTPDDWSDDSWVEGDYHLKSAGWRWNRTAEQWTWDDETSPCIDAGNPGMALGDESVTLDVDPLNRLGENVRVNMGAYGGTAEASMAPPGWALLCDLDNSGNVTMDDFIWMVEAWLQVAENQPPDVSRDGIVNLEDMGLLAQDWLETTSWY
jgi:hypothetical protein